jgi:Transketolase, C-terminal domain
MAEAVEPDPVEAVRKALRARPTSTGSPFADAIDSSPGPLEPGSWCLCSWSDAMGALWGPIRAASGGPGAGPRIFARYDPRRDPLPLGDFAAFGAIARMRVAAPSDSASALAMIEAATASPDPVYVRVPGGPTPPSSDGSFAFGRAPVVRPGADLTVVGVGPLLAEARTLADRFQSIGVDLRVLDGASVKPLDVTSILRAARETGAILTVEPHHALEGLGARVAAVTATAYPIPVRRVGLPDLPVEGSPGAAGSPGAYGIAFSQLEEETWELLRARGKLH